jgi:hypothetical protein
MHGSLRARTLNLRHQFDCDVSHGHTSFDPSRIKVLQSSLKECEQWITWLLADIREKAGPQKSTHCGADDLVMTLPREAAYRSAALVGLY